MGNIFEQFPIEDRYDLKGSKIGRSTPNLNDPLRDKRIALKDQDFEMQQKVLVLQQDEHSQHLKTTIVSDVYWLRSNNLNDYSFLLGICPSKQE